MDDPKAKLLTRIRECTNVLITVSANPSLDQLAGAIGLTLLLNKLGKHATAVFSGEVPSSIEYLKPEATLEKNTDSLRDFIIALDKSKADKLRYKVEDQMVKIFITPYRTALSEQDLEFSQGDYNVDLVIAVGVLQQQDLDNAITSHGRILHDATVSSVNNQENGNLGTIAWVDTSASSLCEMLYALGKELKADVLDGQIATAFLTGIVSETKRFGNEKTTARSMDVSADLMSAGANQQLVAARLDAVKDEEPEPEPEPKPEPAKAEEPKPEPAPVAAGQPEKVFRPAPRVKEEKKDEGSLQVDHEDNTEKAEDLEEIKIDEHGVLYRPTDKPIERKQTDPQPGSSSADAAATPPVSDDNKTSSRIVLEPPTLGGKLTANTEPEGLEPAVDPLASSKEAPLLSHDSTTNEAFAGDTMMPLPEPQTDDSSATASTQDAQTLTQLEQSVDSPHQGNDSAPASAATPDLNAARDAVVDAVSSGVDLMPPPPRVDLNAQPALEDLNKPVQPAPTVSAAPSVPNLPSVNDPTLATQTMPTPTMPTPAFPLNNSPVPPAAPAPASSPLSNHAFLSPSPGLPADNTASPTSSPQAPPPVPPPMMPPNMFPPANSSQAGQDDQSNAGNIPGIPL